VTHGSAEQLLDTLGVHLDAELLVLALTHRSFAHENGGLPTNERLEFLGDSVLGLVVTEHLFRANPDVAEGELAKMRAATVSQRALASVARELGLGRFVLLGKGEQTTGGADKDSILSDTLEAVFGAVYLDGGFDAAERVIGALYRPILRTVDPRTLGKDAKTLLQEHLQACKLPLPVYSVVATHGAAHKQMFEVECAIPKLDIQVLGSGGSRRAAEQAAAKLALEAAQARSDATRSGARRARSAERPAGQAPDAARRA